MTLLLIACTDPVLDDTSAPEPDSVDTGDTGDVDPVDADGDGFFSDEDCDDEDASVYPGATEICDGKPTGCDPDWAGDAGTATWIGDEVEDWTARLAGEADVILEEDGRLQLCEGSWPLRFAVLAEVAIVGMEDDVELDGQDAVAPVSVDGSAAELENLTITGGLATTNVPGEETMGGGGLWCDGGSVVLREVVIERSVSTGAGGGLMAYDCDLVIEDLRLEDNDALVGGGAWISGGSLSAVDWWIEGNLSASTGGGVHVLGVEGDVDDAHFAFNEAVAGAGLALQGASHLTFTNIYAAENLAELGAGVYLDGQSELHLDGGKIKKNEASTAGGGLYATGGNVLGAIGTEVAENVAPSGGGLWLYQDDAVLDDVVLGENEAELGAGAWLGDSRVEVTGSRVRLNLATEGGGFYLDGVDTLSLDATDFTTNTPDDVAYATGETYTLGEGATVTCTASGCE